MHFWKQLFLEQLTVKIPGGRRQPRKLQVEIGYEPSWDTGYNMTSHPT